MTQKFEDVFRLSFAVGPVQTFVSQSRRTRDLWSGSWLLSFLSETALAKAEQTGGHAIIPYRHEHERCRLTSSRSAIGGIPNRFEVSFGNQQLAERTGHECVATFRHSWETIANCIFEKYFHNDVLEKGSQTKSIWDRQISDFWQLSWIVSKTPGPRKLAGLPLSERKHFRNVPASNEPGTKCSMVTSLQELSGWYGRGNWTKQSEFWRQLGGKLSGLDLGDREMLSAVGFVKRMFPEVVDLCLRRFSNALPDGTRFETISPEGDQDALRHQARWPSLAFLAALPWMQDVNANPDTAGEAKRITAKAIRKSHRDENGYWESEEIPKNDFGLGDWARIDAPVWFTSGLNANSPGLPENRLSELKNIQIRLHSLAGSKPVPSYALLLADGDSMGNLLGVMDDPTRLSECLGRFSTGVSKIICPENRNGRVVYAGGDDVFALLSAETALAAADQLRHAYADAFVDQGVDLQATLSVAIVYAHWRYPLKQVIRFAHQLLDDVAKDQTGRDSLAVAVLQGGGLRSIWSAPWNVIRGKRDGCVSFDSLINRFATADDELSQSESAAINSSFLYSLRKQYSALMPNASDLPGKYQSVAEATKGSVDAINLLQSIAHSEYRRRLTPSGRLSNHREATEKYINELMTLCHPWQRDNEGASHSDSNKFSFDGWKIARYLKQVKEKQVVDHEC